MNPITNDTRDYSKNRARNAGLTKLKLVEAALTMFSTRGYDASTTRQIESVAGVKRGLITYHFGSKKALWEASADYIMSIAEIELSEAIRQTEQLEAQLRLGFFVHAYVAFCAKHPELNRLMIQEGMDLDWRLKWLLDRSVRPWYRQVCKIFEQAVTLGLVPSINSHHFYYILTGSATLIFSNAVEAHALSGRNPMEAAVIEDHANAVVNILALSGRKL